MQAAGSVVALDVGGTSMKGWLCDPNGVGLRRIDRPTPVEEGADEVVRAIRLLMADLGRGHPDVRAAGLVVPGLVDAAAGIATYATNIGWQQVPLRQLLIEDLGIPVALDHDVRAGGLAEALLGAARGHSHSLFVPIGTGIAGAIIVNGAVYSGAFGAAGELGHLAVYPGGELCACGQRGCVETYASASAISRRYWERTSARLSAAELVLRLDADEVARRVWAEAVEALAVGLAACTMLLDPGLIVLGGGLSAAADSLTVPLGVRLAALLAWREPPRIVCGLLGSDAGRLGAAILAWRAADRPDVPAGW